MITIKDTTITKTMIFKYVTVLLILIYVIWLMIYASGSTKPFEDVAREVEASLDTSNLVKMDTQEFKRYYGLNGADYQGVLFYSSEFSISAEEVLLVEVKSDKQVQEVRGAIEQRLASRKNDFDGYAPKEVQLLDSAQLKVRGKYIFLAVAPKAETYSEVFAESL